MSVRKCFWTVKRGQRVRLKTLPSTVSRLSRQCGILDISQPYRPPWPVTAIAFYYFCLSVLHVTPIRSLRTAHVCVLPVKTMQVFQPAFTPFTSPYIFLSNLFRNIFSLCLRLFLQPPVLHAEPISFCLCRLNSMW
jgi:hypothetical protein